MARIKRDAKNSAAIKATSTTPLKTGKVQKNSGRVKDTKDLKNSQQFVSPTNRICFVKLRRAHIKDSIGLQNDNIMLQAQCKVIDKFNNGNKLTDTISKVKVKRKIPNKPKKTPEKSRNNVDVNVAKNIKPLTKKSSRNLAATPKNDIREVGDKMPVTTYDIKPIRRCVVKIKQILQNNTENNKILQQTLQDNTKNNIISTPRTTTKCLVRLKRTTKISCNHELTQATRDLTQLQTELQTAVLPVIDEAKRNNFRKLSLNRSKQEKAKATTKSKKNITEYENMSEITSQKQLKTTTTHHNTEKDTAPQTSKLISNYLEKETLAKTNLVKNNHLKKFRHLKTNKPLENKNSTNLESTKFESHLNSTICFAPELNSTLMEFDVTKDKNKQTKIIEENNNDEQRREKEADKSNSRNNSSSQNFANKSLEIEKLLDSLDDDNADADAHAHAETEYNANNKKDNVQDIQTNNAAISNKTNKFFHRPDKNVVKVVQVIVEKGNKNQARRKSSCFRRRRLSLAQRDNIYEFLSQSQTSDSDSNKHLDPAADIIQKLIAQGKVRVATNCKGKGRPKLKRKPVAKKVKQTAVKKVKKNQNKPIVRIADNQKDVEIDDHIDLDDHFMDDYDLDEPFPEVNNNMAEQQQDPVVKRFDNNHPHHISDQEGTFSRLARSVLINQAGRSDLKRQNAQRLLEMAKKYVSTPKNKKMSLPQVALHSNLSPIPMPSPRPEGNASPWRVDEDAHLPRVFNFNRSSGNLPSFSSDFIPSTPRKQTPKNKSMPSSSTSQPQSAHNEIGNQSSNTSLSAHDLFPYPTNDNDIANPTPQATNEQTVLSSFSSNDSNAENMPPPKTAHVTRDDNENIFNLKQYHNPKRSLNNRSPLKAINILEVVHLPPYEPPSKIPQAKDLEKDNEEMFGFEENLNDDSLQVERSSKGLTSQKTHCKKSKKSATEDLFGFEDFLTQSDICSQERCDMETTNNNNKSIHDKLQDLRKLRPDENELQFILLKDNIRNPLKTIAIFDDAASSDTVDVDGMRQRGIKEMLCSTMIHSPQASTSKAALEQLKKRNLRATTKPKFVEDSNLSSLFKDPAPEVTFNENEAHRTYVRPYKRKRRLKENKFVMYLESDESGDEDSAEHNKHHHSHETDTSSEKAPKKKRQRKVEKENPELTEFVHDFNEMCKEVDRYELIVERSA